MDVKEYISSGIIELYVLGSLSKAEAMEVEKMAAAHKDVADEISKTQELLDNYAMLHQRNPSTQLRARIMDKIGDGGVKEEKLEARIRHIHANSSAYKYLIAACIAALFITTFFSYFFYSKWNEAATNYSSLLKDQSVLTANMQEVKNDLENRYQDLLVLRDEDNKMITLNAKDSTKNYAARVYWNTGTRKAYIDVASLPMPPDSMQYQLWAIKDGQPVDAGVFEIGQNMGVQELKTVMGADLWAVTLEKKGGSPVPTMDQMYLISKSS
jgi:anti-sigma-K factor RskA